ncbi:mitochondrial enolase superfamily member 1-like isoform X3 [Schistocerca cancellata]|uniref:mitochondrial enolase superfamily member 1-like isoform X3 n=1 Tax=Schistocerca cancellata TaxID=274614 RepID=UPI002117DDF8|nr:mitochondrial enolase superfamily member 1-like isoform X3 [Schistocerca cancellata]
MSKQGVRRVRGSMPGTGLRIRTLHVRDIRFPTSLGAHGSDAMHTDPDYSCAYVIIYTDREIEGHGLTFTCGRGTEIVVQAVKSLSYLVVGQDAGDIFKDFGSFWRKLTSESQLRWVGPEKGVIHLATAAIVNALWDLWATAEHKPLWKLLVDMDPETLVSTIDFRYISDVITKEEAIQILKSKQEGKGEREEEMRTVGYPAYTTQVGWLGYSSERVRDLCREYLSQGFTCFKVKVGQNLEDDKRRCKIVREIIGWDNKLMVDANQNWDVQQAIDWMKELAEFKPLWIEEPTSPDDVLGHAAIAKALKPLGIGVATGEMCCNRVMFKQFLQAGGMQYCQIDSCRIGGVNEILSVYLMAYKLGVPVCPHAGGVGLCEMVQHLQIFDYICLSRTKENRVIEYVDQQHEHFENPTNVKHAHYIAPTAPGYSTKMKAKSAESYEYPFGHEWEKMFNEGTFQRPHAPLS